MLVAVAAADGWAPAGAQTGPVMTSTPPPLGVVGNGYLHQFAADPLHTAFVVTSGSLPPGIVLIPQGFLTGVPTAAGAFGPTTVCATTPLLPPVCQVVTIVIDRRTVGILPAPSPGGPVGTALLATATLVGAFLPAGSMTFRLFGDPSCHVEAMSSVKPVDVFGAATSDDFRSTVPGTYRWTVTYSGDANNEPVSTACGDAGAVAITGAAPPSSSSTSSTVPAGTTSTTSTSSTSTTIPTGTTTTTTSTLAPTTTSSTTTTSTTLAPTTTSSTTTTTSTTLAPTTTSSTTTTTSTTLAPTTTSTTLRPTSTTSTTAPLPPQDPTLRLAGDTIRGIVGALFG